MIELVLFGSKCSFYLSSSKRDIAKTNRGRQALFPVLSLARAISYLVFEMGIPLKAIIVSIYAIVSFGVSEETSFFVLSWAKAVL
jgi:hypothetical protein